MPNVIDKYHLCVVKNCRIGADLIAKAAQMKLIMQFGVGLEGQSHLSFKGPVSSINKYIFLFDFLIDVCLGKLIVLVNASATIILLLLTGTLICLYHTCRDHRKRFCISPSPYPHWSYLLTSYKCLPCFAVLVCSKF